jgi:acetyltransferase-like isoleucine patch superfamily enzyme
MPPENNAPGSRFVNAVHGLQQIHQDADFEVGLTEFLIASYGRDRLIDVYDRFTGDGDLDRLMRRAIWRALSRRFGQGVQIGSHAAFKHPETFEIGSGVFIGAQTYIQGRFDGRCVIGDHAWIGPQSYLDARDLVIGDYVGWGPGAKILGSTHTGVPLEIPIIKSDLRISRVTIEAGADIGTNAVILPGVTVGEGSIVGAGAIVTHDVPPFSVMAGVPARFMRWREGYKQEESKRK